MPRIKTAQYRREFIVPGSGSRSAFSLQQGLPALQEAPQGKFNLLETGLCLLGSLPLLGARRPLQKGCAATILPLPGWHGGSDSSAALPDAHQGMLKGDTSSAPSSPPLCLQCFKQRSPEQESIHGALMVPGEGQYQHWTGLKH